MKTKTIFESFQGTVATTSLLQHTATHCNTLQHTATSCSTVQHSLPLATQLTQEIFKSLLNTRLTQEILERLLCTQLTTACCSVLHCVAVCCSVLQCVAVCCSVLQCVAVCRVKEGAARCWSQLLFYCVHCHLGWPRLVGSIELKVSSAEYRFFYRALSQKRPII